MSESFANVSLIRLIRQAMCNDITLETSWILHAAAKEVLELRTFVRTWWRIGGIVIFYLETSILLMFVNDIFATHGFCKEVLHTSPFSFAFMILYVSVFSLSKRRTMLCAMLVL